MKKLLPIGMLTLCLGLIAQEQAAAWINSRAGVGLNWSWQSGGNNLFWGFLRDGQPPAPCPIPGCQPPMMPGCGPGPMQGPMGCPQGYPFPGPHQSYPTNEFPFFGRTNPSSPANTPQTAQGGYGGTHHPVSYSPAAAHQTYRYPSYAPQYPNYNYPWYGR